VLSPSTRGNEITFLCPLSNPLDFVPKNRGERLQFMLSADELAAVDDFRHRKRMPSRGSAVQQLLKRGLTVAGFTSAAFGAKSDFPESTLKGRKGR
jgi:hypothetical protein